MLLAFLCLPALLYDLVLPFRGIPWLPSQGGQEVLAVLVGSGQSW